MRMFFALAFVTAATLAGAVSAQVAPYPAYGQAYPSYGAAMADRQRYEMEQVRVRGLEAESLARQQSADTRLTLLELLELQARQSNASAPASADVPLRSLEQERATREAATTARQTTTASVAQIDRWLDRSEP